MADVKRYVIADDFWFGFNPQVIIGGVVLVTDEIVGEHQQIFIVAMHLCAFFSCSRVATYKEKKKRKREIEATEIFLYRESILPMNIQSTLLSFMCIVSVTSVSDVFHMIICFPQNEQSSYL